MHQRVQQCQMIYNFRLVRRGKTKCLCNKGLHFAYQGVPRDNFRVIIISISSVLFLAQGRRKLWGTPQAISVPGQLELLQ